MRMPESGRLVVSTCAGEGGASSGSVLGAEDGKGGVVDRDLVTVE